MAMRTYDLSTIQLRWPSERAAEEGEGDVACGTSSLGPGHPNPVVAARTHARPVAVQASIGGSLKWSGREDLNLRSSGPKPDAIPDFATARKPEKATAWCAPRKRLDVDIGRESAKPATPWLPKQKR